MGARVIRPLTAGSGGGAPAPVSLWRRRRSLGRVTGASTPRPWQIRPARAAGGARRRPGLRRRTTAHAARGRADLQAVVEREPLRAAGRRARGRRERRGRDEPLPRHGQHRAVRRAERQARRTGLAPGGGHRARWRCSTTWSRRSASPATRSSSPGAPSRPTRSRPRSAARGGAGAGDRRRSSRPRRRWPPRSPTGPGSCWSAPRTTRPGPAVTHTELAAFLDPVPADVVVVVDEAYREFVRSEDPVDAAGPGPRARQRRDHADAGQGLRAGRPADRLPGRLRRGRRRRPQVRAALRGVLGGAGRGRRRARVRAASWPSGSRRSWPSASGWSRRCGHRAGRCPRPTATSCGSALGERTPAFAAAADEAGIMVRPYGTDGVRITIAEPAGNDVFLGVADAFEPKA